MNNIILNTDSYKISHWLQYPPNTQNVFSYVEARGPKYTNTLFFGFQMFKKEYLEKPVTREMIDEAEDFLAIHGEPFNRSSWLQLINKHGGYFPVKIKTVPEGLIIPTSNALATIVNTDPDFYWLTSYLETSMLRAIWYPTTVATISRNIKTLILQYLEKTGDPSLIDFKLHDFGARGVSSFESAGIGGAAHLVNFMGTDTLSGALCARKYYGENMAGFSIPAAEHSTMTTWGGPSGEVDAMRNMLTQFAKPGSLVAVVSDSYDIFNAAENIWGRELKQEVLDSGATVVVRPDSGDPPTVVNRVVQILDERFGSTINDKGFRVLNPAIRVIQGDGIEYDTIKEILFRLTEAGYSADNIAFGMGGALLQKMDRDTFQFAMKASAIRIDNEWKDVYKDPVTKDANLDKVSKRGMLMLYKTPINKVSVYRTERVYNGFEELEVLETVFENGESVKDYSFAEIRENSNL